MDYLKHNLKTKSRVCQGPLYPSSPAPNHFSSSARISFNLAAQTHCLICKTISHFPGMPMRLRRGGALGNGRKQNQHEMCWLRGRIGGRRGGAWRCPAPCCHKLMQVPGPGASAAIDDVGWWPCLPRWLSGSVVLSLSPGGFPQCSPAHIDNRLILL